jgi:glycosyltransferase involved in cell wall biosynthesis
MACRLACVATDVGGNPEVVIDGETGFLVSPENPRAMAAKTTI